MKVMRAVVAGIVVVSLCGAAFAAESEGGKERKGPPRGADRKGHFEEVDADGSGGLSLAEFKAAHEKRMAAMKERMGDRWDPERAAKHPGAEEIFKKIDADGDGQATKEEMKAHFQKMRGQHGGRRGGPRGGGRRGGPEGGKGKPEGAKGGCDKDKDDGSL